MYEQLTQQIWGIEKNIETVDAEIQKLSEMREQLVEEQERLLLERRQHRQYFVFDSYYGTDRKRAEYGPAPLGACLAWIQSKHPRKVFGKINWVKDWKGFVMAAMLGGFYALVWEDEVDSDA